MTNQERYASTTPFQTLYNRFLGKITDDMYLEWTEADTHADILNILLSALPRFEFPKFKIYDYDPEAPITEDGIVVSKGLFKFVLSQDEIEIITDLMVIEWIKRQIASVDVTRMKYSSSDFKFTSQANHLDKLLRMKKEFEAENKHAQKIYNRRKVDQEGYIRPNFAGLGGSE